MLSYSGSRVFRCLLAFASTALPVISQVNPGLHRDSLRAAVNTPPATNVSGSSVLTPEMRGDIFMARKMFREAVDKYREMPESSVTDNKIGIAFHQMMQFGLAKKQYERAIKLDPSYAEAINNLGTIYYATKNYGRAISSYKRSLKKSGATGPVFANLGAAYFAKKDYKHASFYYSEALRLDPDVFERHNGFGTLLQERTVTELALFHLSLAKTYAKAGSNERALIYLRKALEEGVKDRGKIPAIPEFAAMKNSEAFQQLLAENPKPL
ncbi:MAG: Tetratricopeptide 2 repeat protein [Bryobacterales bacterium]|nr:Tetratricopeptide 2 repeat protein [Bryobacterales bacterium]